MDREQGTDEGSPVSEEPTCEITVGTHSNGASLREWTTKNDQDEDEDHSGMICDHHWDILSRAMEQHPDPDPRIVQAQ